MPALSFFKKPWFRFIRKWTIRIVLGYLVLSILLVILFKWVNPKWNWTMLTQKMQVEKKGLVFQKKWVDIENISTRMQLSAICGEDQHFTEHFGFDFKAIQAAAAHNANGGSVRGASTITQQTAKNVFLWNGGGFFRKGIEAWYTLLIEIIWGKKRIMEVYLNVAETGEGIFGVEAAAQKYFHIPASKLNTYQAVQIASILPSPRRWNMNKYPAYGRRRVILTAMNYYHIELTYLK